MMPIFSNTLAANFDTAPNFSLSLGTNSLSHCSFSKPDLLT